jgi:uncharacterized membrane protein required for colicin V production
MLIWLIVIGTFVILGVTGYYKGAIRSLVSLAGLLFALFFTLPLSVPLRPLVPKVGLTNPAWPYIVPPLVVFLLFVLVFGGLGFLVHHKIALRFKYSADDYTRIRWERLNQRLGVCVGFVASGIYTILIGLIIYIFGYPAVQVAGEDSPALLRFLSEGRKEIKDSGLDRTLASMDPMPENYYIASDVVGLVYHNNILQDRLSNYPAFLSLGQRQEFQDIATDTDLQGMLQTKAPIMNILNHAKVQAVIASGEILQEFKQIDLKDLYQYLKTGKSAKYEEERILGRWKLDTSATLTRAKRRNPDMTAAEMTMVKRLITIFLQNVTMLATPDNKAWLKMELGEEAKRIVEIAQAAVKAASAPPPSDDSAPPRMDDASARRYGLLRQGARSQAPQPAAAPAPAKPLPGVPDLNLTSQGTWQREGTKYTLKLQDEKGAEHSAEAEADEERLLVSVQGQSLVFVR